jgi:hypothetical protein
MTLHALPMHTTSSVPCRQATRHRYVFVTALHKHGCRVAVVVLYAVRGNAGRLADTCCLMYDQYGLLVTDGVSCWVSCRGRCSIGRCYIWTL